MAARKKPPLLLILSNEIRPTETPGTLMAGHAVRRLMQEATPAGFDVLAGPFTHFQLQLLPGQSASRLLASGKEVRPAAAIIRSTTGGATAIARAIDLALRRQGCVLLDPPDRFQGGALDRADFFHAAQGTGLEIAREILMGKAALLARLKAHDYRKGKLVAKPLSGSGGHAVRWVDGSPQSIEAVLAVGAAHVPPWPPFVIEPAMAIREEYRIYTLDGETIGAVHRMIAEPDRPANASQGAELVEIVPPADVLEGLAKVMRGGLIGWDVARLVDGRIVVIEMNRPPAWRHFDKISKTNIAALVLARLKARLKAEG